MDGSREADLSRLRSVFTNTSKSKFVRATAYRAYVNIQRQLKDRTLIKMRHELIRAVRANDHSYIERVEKRLNDYSWRNGYTQPS